MGGGILGLMDLLGGGSPVSRSDLANLPERGNPLFRQMTGLPSEYPRLPRRDIEALDQAASDARKAYLDAYADTTKYTPQQVEALKATAISSRAIAEAARKAEADAKSLAEEMRKLRAEVAERALHPYGMLAAERRTMEIMDRFPGANRAEVERLLRPQLNQEVSDILRRSGLKVNPDGTISRDMQQIKLTGGVTPSGDISAAGEARLAAQGRLMEREGKEIEENARELIRLNESILTTNREMQTSAAMGGIRIRSILAPDSLTNRLQVAQSEMQVIKENSEQEYKDKASKVADLYGDAAGRETAYYNLRLKHAAEVNEAELKYMETLATERRKQIDEIKGEVEPLYHTLFTDPKKFGSQLRSTLQEAALKPIVTGLSETTAQFLHPMIFGATGTGGIAGAMRGVFGGTGRLNDVKLTSEGAVPVHVVNVGGPGGGPGGGGPGGGGGGAPNLFNLPMSSPWAGPAGLLAMSPLGGAAPGADIMNLPMSSPWAGASGIGLMSPFGGFTGGGRGIASLLGGGLRSLFGGGTSMTGGARDLVSGWKHMLGYGAVHGQTPGGESLARAAAGAGEVPTGAFSLKGLATSPLAKAGLMTGGMMLAQGGLLGQNRGTVGGMFEGMFGGAAIGAALAPGPLMPMGAAIGAAAGLAIGLGEIIAGVESPRNEAKRLARNFYHIDINNTTADQIVGIAQQSYGGRVSIAIRSPEVRQMLGLYAAGTGQARMFPQSADTPHGASLVESGGRLMQQSVFQYGQSYTYQSNLPVYGGGSTGTLPVPGGNISLALNIDGDSAAKFMAGRVVTPEVIESQYASAMSSSTGRVDQALMLSQPGAIRA
jgi:hypothetical protein